MIDPEQRESLQFAYDLIMNTPGGNQAHADRIAAMLSTEQPVIRLWIHYGMISDIYGLPEGVTLRVIDCDTEGALTDDTKPLESDADKLGAGGHERAFISEYEEDTLHP